MNAQVRTPLLWIGNQPVFPFCGAEDGSAGDGGNGGGNGSGDGDNGGNGDGGGSTTGNGDLETLQRRLAAADRAKGDAEKRANELQAWKDEQERKGASDLQNAERDRDAAQAEAASLAAEVRKLRLENAFLRNNTHAWHNAGLAFKELDLNGVTNDKGEVDDKALKAAIDRLAKDHAYLLKDGGKPAYDKDGFDADGYDKDGYNKDGKDRNGKGRPKKSGDGDGNGDGSGGGGYNREDLNRRFPALRR